jgi:transcriptional/translational regulatory protein YebC/TACO1
MNHVTPPFPTLLPCCLCVQNRSASEVRTAVTKSGGKMADPGSVLFNFQRSGLVLVDAAGGEDVVRACV